MSSRHIQNKSIYILLYTLIFIVSCISIFMKQILLVKIIMTLLSFFIFKKLINKMKNSRLTSIDYTYILFMIQPIFLYFKTSDGTQQVSQLSFIVEVIILIFCILLIIFNYINNTIKFPYILNSSSKYIFLFIIYIGVTIFFTRHNKFTSIYWYIKLISVFLLVHSLIYVSLKLKRNKNYIIHLIYYILTFIQIYLWNLSWILPDAVIIKVQSGYIRFGGEIIHPTTMGLLSAITLCIALKKILFDKKEVNFHIINFIISFITMVGTFGRVSIISGILGCIFLILSYKTKYINMIILSFIGVLNGIILTMLLFNNGYRNIVSDYILRGQGVEGILSLSGRKDVNIYTIELFKQKPFLGYGFISSSNLIQSSNKYFANYSFGIDNAFLTILVELGIVGFLLFIFSIVSYLVTTSVFNKYLYQNINNRDILMSKIIVFLVLLTGLFSPSFGSKARIHTLILFTVLFNNIYWFKYIRYKK